MIIVGFIIDYIVMLLFPFNSYFIVYNLDKNKLFRVVLVAILVDLMYLKVFFSIFILLLYFIVRLLEVKEKYSFIKNLLLYLIFFYVSYGSFNNYVFIVGVLSYLMYGFLVKMYKKLN